MPRPSLMDRVKELRRKEKEQRAIAAECFNFRPEYGDLFDAASDAAADARALRAELLRTMKLNHLAASAKAERNSTSTRTLEQA